MSVVENEVPTSPLLRYCLKPLAKWLNDQSTEDLCIQEPGVCWVRRRGAWERHEVDLHDADMMDIAILAGAMRRQDVGVGSPLLAAELPNAERIQVCIPPVVGTVSLTIRKPSASVVPLGVDGWRYDADGWNRFRRGRVGRDMTELLALFDHGAIETFLAAAVRARLTLLFTGPTGAGKTSWSRRCAAAIDPRERIITIEDVPELTILQPNHVRLLFSRDDRNEVAIGPEALLQAALRMRPDRIMVAELRGPEAFVYASEVMTGHPGSISTIHGSDASTAFRRLFMLCKSSTAGAALDDETLMGMLGDAVDVICPLTEDGAFRVGPTWFAADAKRRNETAIDLLRS